MASFSTEIQQEWYKILDTLFGWNYVNRNIALAIEMASSCTHPEAQWLVKTFQGKHVKTQEEFQNILMQCDQSDAHTLCFLGLCYDRKDPLHSVLMRQAAEQGFSLAQAMYAACRRSIVNFETSFKFATLAAAKNERYAFYILGLLYGEGNGCERNREKSKECFMRAANFGEVWAMVMLGKMFDPSDVQKWKWWGRAAKAGKPFQFYQQFSKQVKHGRPNVMFAIGRVLYGSVDFEKRSFFNDDDDASQEKLVYAKQAIDFYFAQLVCCRKAVDNWTLVGIRFRVVKDIRKLIGLLIWKSRKDALYTCTK